MVSYKPLYRLYMIRDTILPAYEKLDYIGDYMYHYLCKQVVKLWLNVSIEEFTEQEFNDLIHRLDKLVGRI